MKRHAILLLLLAVCSCFLTGCTNIEGEFKNPFLDLQTVKEPADTTALPVLNKLITLSLPGEDTPSASLRTASSNRPPQNKNVTIFGYPATPVFMPDDEEPCWAYQATVPENVVKNKPIEITYKTLDNKPVYILIKGELANKIRKSASDPAIEPALEVERNPKKLGDDLMFLYIELTTRQALYIAEVSDDVIDSICEDEARWGLYYSSANAIGSQGENEVSEALKKQAASIQPKSYKPVAVKLCDSLEDCENVTLYGLPLLGDFFRKIPTETLLNDRAELTFKAPDGTSKTTVIVGEAAEGIKRIARSSDKSPLIYICNDNNMWFADVGPILTSTMQILVTSRTDADIAYAIGTLNNEISDLDEDQVYTSKICLIDKE